VDKGEEELVTLKDLLSDINEPYAGFLDENDKLLTHLIDLLKQDPVVIQAFSAHNTMDMIIETLKSRFENKAFEEMGKYAKLLTTMGEDQVFTDRFFEMTMGMMAEYLNKSKLPEYNEEILVELLVDKFADRFEYLCTQYDVNLTEVVQMMLLVMQSAQSVQMKALQKLPVYISHLYRGELLEGQPQMYYTHLLTKFEAFLRQLYKVSRGRELHKPIEGVDKMSDGLRWVIAQFRDLNSLFHTTNPQLQEFKDIYLKLFSKFSGTGRNVVAHAAPEVPEGELPAYIDAIVSMYLFAMTISVKDVNRQIALRQEHPATLYSINSSLSEMDLAADHGSEY
jgi:type I restriction enzyme R subunit